tara:strand:+ start:18909 stop:19631 length:723 start_codon:yes stop_codon:yes gene_type:complete
MIKRKIDLEYERNYENKLMLGSGAREKQEKYYWATEAGIDRFNYMVSLGITGKIVLEIGCSDGEHAETYIKTAAFVYGVDISDVGVELAKSKGLANTSFQVCDAHQLPFEDEFFDCVIVNSLLHHLDLNKGLKEISRVLKPGGSLWAREPLGINPFFKLYRYLTPGARTPDEQPFLIADFKIIRNYFIFNKVSYFGLLSIASAFFKSHKLRSFLTSIDLIFSKTPLKYLYWNIAGEFIKK